MTLLGTDGGPVVNTDSNRVSIRDLADELGCIPQSIHKLVERKRFEKQTWRDSERRNQLVATISAEDAEFIRTYWRKSKGTADSEEMEEPSNSTEKGVFYVMQLEPELDPGRIKVGFTSDIEARLRKHRCAAPHTAIVKTWPCRRRWELTAIDCITRELDQVHTEVFSTNSLERTVCQGDEFFSLMNGV